MDHTVTPPGRVAIDMDESGVAHVRLIRADKMNALDPDMFAARSQRAALRGAVGRGAQLLCGARYGEHG